MPTIDREALKRFRSWAYAGQRDLVAAALAETAMDRGASARDCERDMTPCERAAFRQLCPESTAVDQELRTARTVIEHWVTRRYASDGAFAEPWSMLDFREANASDPDMHAMAAQVYALGVLGSVTLGGGAVAETLVTRLS